jgi:aminodeoxyfutalosine synthase
MNNPVSVEILIAKEKDIELRSIGEKVLEGQRLHFDEGVLLFEKADLPYVGALANYIREKRHGDKTYFNRNFI